MVFEWDTLAKFADIIGIAAFAISVWTLLTTRGIRKSMLVHVESSDYRKAIGDQIHELEAYRAILIERESQKIEQQFFTRLTTMLEEISMSYETILPKKVLKRISGLIEHIRNKPNLTETSRPKHDMDVCISQLNFIIAKLKKEKEII